MNNYYNPFGLNYQIPTQNTTIQKASNKIYVCGLEGARSYPLNPNSEMILCDDTKDIIYDVIVDQSGKRTVTSLDIVVHKDEPPVDMSIYATKDDIEKLRKELKKIKEV